MTPAEIARGFGRKVRERRRALGLSQRRLAGLADLSQCRVSTIEAGKAAGVNGTGMVVLYRLATALGCKPADLLPSEDGS